MSASPERRRVCSLTGCSSPVEAIVRWSWSTRKFAVCAGHHAELAERQVMTLAMSSASQRDESGEPRG
jgi:hypothetical protein